MRAAIVDTGPLVAFLDRAEHHHRWVAEGVEELDTPLLVCEPVLAETMHLLARFSRAQDAMGATLDGIVAGSGAVFKAKFMVAPRQWAPGSEKSPGRPDPAG
jgi:predicted nucleic acid-binding protein